MCWRLVSLYSKVLYLIKPRCTPCTRALSAWTPYCCSFRVLFVYLRTHNMLPGYRFPVKRWVHWKNVTAGYLKSWTCPRCSKSERIPMCTYLLSLFNPSTVCWYCPFILLSLLQETEKKEQTFKCSFMNMLHWHTSQLGGRIDPAKKAHIFPACNF